MIVIDKKSDCCGCGACANACPVSCITMCADSEGFSYPHADASACIGCGKCDRICPIINAKADKARTTGNQPYPTAYAAINNVDKTRSASSSGGVFSLIAEYVLQRKGVVFGAVWGEDFSVTHVAIENERDIALMRGSKYPQSDIDDCFKLAKQFLDEGRLVLFTGTPCQISALLRFLNRSYPNLITQDLICHGTPSPAVWQAYLKYRSEAARSEIAEVSLRKKLDGKRSTSVYFRFENGTEYVTTPHGRDDFMKLFLYNKCLRPSCHHCKFKGLRESDITLADFWGVNSVAPDINDGKGVSLVFINTPKGAEILQAVSDSLRLKEVAFKRSLRRNPSYFHSTTAHPLRAKFFKDFCTKPFKKVLNRHKRLL